MCVGDWRLGRLIRSQQTTFSLATTVSATILPNRQRVGLIIGMGRQVLVGVNYLRIDMDSTDLTRLDNYNTIVIFTLAQHGDIPTKGFTLTAQGATINGSFTELILPEDVLAAGLESFYGDYQQWIRQH